MKDEVKRPYKQADLDRLCPGCGHRAGKHRVWPVKGFPVNCITGGCACRIVFGAIERYSEVLLDEVDLPPLEELTPEELALVFG
jgi:hypothetical protein